MGWKTIKTLLLFLVGIVFFPITIGYFLSGAAMRLTRRVNVSITKKEMRASSIGWAKGGWVLLLIVICVGLWVLAYFYSIKWCRTHYTGFFGLYVTTSADTVVGHPTGSLIWLPLYWGHTHFGYPGANIGEIYIWKFNSDFLFLPPYGRAVSWHWFVDWLVNHYIPEYLIYGFSGFLVFKILTMLIADTSIKKTLEEDIIKTQEAQYNNAKYVAHHKFTDFLYKFVNYRYQEKIQYKVETAIVKKTHEMTMGNGVIVSRKSSILFFKEHWRYNAVFAGAAKSGITNDMMNWVLANAYHNHPVIFLDSDYNIETKNNFKKIADMHATDLFSIDFIDEKNIYNPFFGKDASQAAEMVAFTFFKGQISNDTNADIFNTFLKMENDKTEFTFPNIIKAFAHNEEISKPLKSFYAAFKKYLVTNMRDGIKVHDILTPKTKGPILYFVTPNKIKSDETHILKRLFFKDVLLSSDIGKKDREARNTTALFCFHGAHDLFNNPNEVASAMGTFTLNNFAIGIDVKAHTIKDADADIVREMFFNAKTFFIHRNSDKIIANILGLAIDGSRVVQIGFQTKEITWRDTQGKKLEDVKKLEDTYKASIGKIITSLSTLQIGEMYFKTIHVAKWKRFQKNTNLEDIIYDAPIQASTFNSNLEGVSKT